MECKYIYEPEAFAETLQSFLRKKERVLLCFPKEGSLIGPVLEEMIIRCEGVPVYWESDLSWKSLLKSGFREHCSVAIGGPEIILSLTKLSKRVGTPLFIRNVLMVGEKPDDWLVGFVEKGLDCRVRGCYCHLQDHQQEDPVKDLRQELCRWTSVLDFKLEKTAAGLSLEMIVFPREKLPKLPSFAKLMIREWDADKDCPVNMPLPWKKMIFSKQNH